MINLDLSFQPPLIFLSTYADHQSFDLLSLTRVNLNDQSNVLLSTFDNSRHLYLNLSKKSLKIILLVCFIFLPSLFESRDEIPVKWGRIVTPQNFYFGMCIGNTK
jgi:hypothetical protein